MVARSWGLPRRGVLAMPRREEILEMIGVQQTSGEVLTTRVVHDE